MALPDVAYLYTTSPSMFNKRCLEESGDSACPDLKRQCIPHLGTVFDDDGTTPTDLDSPMPTMQVDRFAEFRSGLSCHERVSGFPGLGTKECSIDEIMSGHVSALDSWSNDPVVKWNPDVQTYDGTFDTQFTCSIYDANAYTGTTNPSVERDNDLSIISSSYFGQGFPQFPQYYTAENEFISDPLNCLTDTIDCLRNGSESVSKSPVTTGEMYHVGSTANLECEVIDQASLASAPASVEVDMDDVFDSPSNNNKPQYDICFGVVSNIEWFYTKVVDPI